jgi:hypothetical protein
MAEMIVVKAVHDPEAGVCSFGMCATMRDQTIRVGL